MMGGRKYGVTPEGVGATIPKTARKKKKTGEKHTDVNSSFKAEILRMIQPCLDQEANLLSATSRGLHSTMEAR